MKEVGEEVEPVDRKAVELAEEAIRSERMSAANVCNATSTFQIVLSSRVNISFSLNV